MRLEIKSRAMGRTFHFWAQDGGGYIRLENPRTGALGATGQQITDRSGSTLTCEGWDSFEHKCRSWYRRQLRAFNG